MANIQQILKDLQDKVYHPVYLLMGDEPYYIDQISDYIEKNVLNEMEKEFNQQILYGLETDVVKVIAEAKRYPMMANHTVIIVKEAQNLKNIELLESYVQNPQTTTILVLCYKYKKVDKRKAFAKAIGKKGIVFESKKLYDNQIPEWVIKYAKNKGFSMSPKVGALVAEFLGSDLTKITNEIQKLAINLKKGDEITPTTIEKYIGISKEYNYFELNNAIGKKSVVKSNQIIQYFSGNEKKYPALVVISSLFKYFSQLLHFHYLKNEPNTTVASAIGIHPFFVKDYQVAARNYNIRQVVIIISHLREYDLKTKGVDSGSTSSKDLLRELIYKILHT